MKNSPPIPTASFGNWVELLEARISAIGEDIAFVFLDDEGQEVDALTYRELGERSRAVAAALTSKVVAGERALLLHPPGLDYMVAFYGCLYAGVIAIPLFPPQRSRLAHIDEVARDATASIVLSTTGIVSGMDEAAGDRYVESLPRIAVDSIRPAGEKAPIIDRSGSDIAYLQYTSGSTSAPKGVIISHEMMLQQCAELAAGWGVDSSSVVVSWLPHFHDFGQVSSVLMPIFVGSRAVLMAPSTFVKDPIRWLSAVSVYRGTHSGSPNFAFDLCVQKTTPAQRAELDLSSWRLVSNGAEPVRKSTLERFNAAFRPAGLRPTALTPGYGLAEATLKVTSGTPESALATTRFDTEALGRRKVVPTEAETGTELVGCGISTLPTEIAIVAPETGELVAADEIGEIWVSGPIVSPGYWNRLQDSETVFRARIVGNDPIVDTEDGRTFLRTGDLGFWYAGELYICGRVKNLMIVNGVNYYLEDIESTVVDSDESLRAGAVLAFSIDRDGQENLVLAAEFRTDSGRDPAELVTVMHDAVARKHGIAPVVIVLIKAGTVPRTTSGKLRRQQCQIDFLAGTLSEAYRWEGLVSIETSTPAATSASAMPSMNRLVQQGLLAEAHRWITERLGPEAAAVDVTRSLTDHGLGSLDQMHLHEVLETWSGKRFPPELLWDATSIEGMTHAIAEHLTTGGVAAPAEDAAPAADSTTGVGAH